MFHGKSVVRGVVSIFTDEHRDVIHFIVSLSVKASFHSKHACAATSRAQGYDERDLYFVNIGCPTSYQTRHFFNNSETIENVATKQTHTTDTFLFISHTTNVLLFKSHCNIFIGFRIIKAMAVLVGSGTPCITKDMNGWIPVSCLWCISAPLRFNHTKIVSGAFTNTARLSPRYEGKNQRLPLQSLSS
jgi:hypothetical protein